MSLYFVAIEPSPEISEKSKKIAQDFAVRFSAEKAFKSFPHITVIPPFQFDEKNESEVVGKFKKAELKTKPFEVRLNNFGSFANRRNPVIFIKPEISNELKDIYQSFRNAMSFNYVDHFNPHLTVAYRDLTFENFEKAWEEYGTKEFSASFNVEKIGLYKHLNGKWNLIETRLL